MRNGVNVFCWMSFCAALMGGCKEAPAEIPVVGVEDVLVDNIEIYGDYVGLIKAASRVEINEMCIRDRLIPLSVMQQDRKYFAHLSLLSEKWHKKSRKPLKDFLLNLLIEISIEWCF